MRPALDPTGHRVPRTKPTCLLHTWRPHRQRPFTLVFHLHQHESRPNLHLQYLAKNQSTQRCQSLVTQGSDHPPVLEPHMVLTLLTHRSHTSWAKKIHKEQLAWTLSQHIGERLLRRGYHLGMPTRRTNQLFLKPQPWQSSDQIEFTQARQKVKAQVTLLPMSLLQLTRRTSQKETSHTRRLKEIRSEHLTLGNDHAN
jgi:hypothetical protein